MAEPIQTSPAATDAPDQLSRAATFERHALARLAEEVETQVDPAVFAAAFDLFRVANRLMYDFEANVHRPLGMSWAGFRVLFCTWIEDEVEPRELARLCAVSRGTVSSVLNTLERDALVSRRKQSADRRVVTVMITDRGRRRVTEAFDLQHARERQWLGAFDRETITGLVALLRHLLELPRPAVRAESSARKTQ
ncbi:MAG: MarR family winged helix-turn-helix transcriptional regulator [Rhodospirillales bacterium]|nr:MarR family winged helix-turn-helix transcriptional regulator [Rhodospirillales bacterium]